MKLQKVIFLYYHVKFNVHTPCGPLKATPGCIFREVLSHVYHSTTARIFITASIIKEKTKLFKSLNRGMGGYTVIYSQSGIVHNHKKRMPCLESTWIRNLELMVCIEQINHEVLLYSIGNCIQHHVISYNGKEYEKECVSESLCYIAVKTQHCKTAILQ